MVRVRLLGSPSIEATGGGSRSLRGHKAWAVLARLVLAEHPVARRQLAAELFPETIDPLGSLRWCLAGIRKAIGCPDAFVGDPIDHRVPAHVTVDVLDLLAGRLDPVDAAGELLEGLDPRCGPEFATWLLVARQHLSARIDALLREEAIAALSRGDNARAARRAERLVRRTPYDEGAHVLLLRALVDGGNAAAAQAHVATVERTFAEELGTAPSEAVRSAARTTVAGAPLGVSAATQAGALLDAGRAAVAAGAIDAGVDCLRRAAAGAEEAGEPALLAEALLALGSTLVRSARGFDDEGSVVLDRAAVLAADVGASAVAGSAHAERAYADALAGRRPEAARRLADAERLAGGDDSLLASIQSVAGFNLGDWGRGAEALDRYEDALGHARRAGDRRREGWVLGVGAWMLLQDGRHDEARRWALRCLDVVRAVQWASFEPFVAALHAELDLCEGITDGPWGPAALERSFAMSCQLSDPCWEAATARALALHLAARGAVDEAVRWITDARVRSLRKTDSWAGLVGATLVTEAELRLAAGERAAAGAAARDALALAARAHLDGLLPRALALVTERTVDAAVVSPAAPPPAPAR